MTAGVKSLHCICYGVQFHLSADSDDTLTKMLASAPLGTQVRIHPFARAKQFTLLQSRPRLRYRLVVDDDVAAESGDLPELLQQLGRDLTVHVADHAHDRVFLHAGVVGWQGRALIFPGTSFAGKTTLVAELVRAGAIYYSDEYAVLDEEGRVHPYARDLQVREAGRPEQVAASVGRFGGSAGDVPIPVSHVIFVKYVEHGQWYPEPVSAGMATLEMLRHAIPVRRTPGRVMATLAKMMQSATAIRSERGEASEAAYALLKLSEVPL